VAPANPGRLITNYMSLGGGDGCENKTSGPYSVCLGFGPPKCSRKMLANREELDFYVTLIGKKGVTGNFLTLTFTNLPQFFRIFPKTLHLS
jgi:hypothetical protein